MTDAERFKHLDSMRKDAKVVNYSALYGVGVPSLSRNSGMSQKDAKKLLKAFWDMNWSIKKVAEDAHVKTLSDGSMWIHNPISGYYYPLRYDKDRWSTLNQGTGVYVFDLWVMFARKAGVKIRGQIHDEVIVYCDNKSYKEVCDKLVKSMEKVNEALQLNVKIEVDYKIGKNYAEVH